MESKIADVRRFNRFYTQKIGVLSKVYLESDLSLTEGRVLYEIANGADVSAADVGRALGLDAGYLSRILRRFESTGLIERVPSKSDARRSHLRLLPRGKKTFAMLDARSTADVKKMLETLAPTEQERVVGAMHTIARALEPRDRTDGAFVLRPPRPGDYGWMVHRHGVLYAEEYGWDETCEALIARIVADFAEEHDPKRERCWIAERDGETVGSVLLVKKSRLVAQLRLLLVEPSARGLGIGSRLVDECIRFAKQAGYKKMTLWTNSVLVDARRIYERAGFELTAEEAHHSFGHDLVAQTFERAL
jgi:DNA-binding MarR family transcriptional regulator/N-acetylglutamate synthase-like GNAT family acetyltransferase